nr:phosphate ABC transporter, permease protein PstA [Bacillota bacterium]
MERRRAEKHLAVRKWKNRVAAGAFFLATSVGIAALAVLIGAILRDGLPYLTWDFLTNVPSRIPEKAGIRSALFGSLWLMVLTAPVAFVLGVATAIYLEEYAKPGRLTRLIQTNIHNLAGVPSIVFGILGLTLFVRGIGLGRSVLAGALTMALLVLPIIVVAAQEALRAVPSSLRHASYALGATRWQTIRRVVLPAALPSILTGTILAMSRAIGETAPLIMIGALTFVAFVPTSPLDAFTVLPIQIFNWVSRPQEAFHHLAAAGIIVLLVVLLSMNLTAVLLRNKFQKRY